MSTSIPPATSISTSKTLPFLPGTNNWWYSSMTAKRTVIQIENEAFISNPGFISLSVTTTILRERKIFEDDASARYERSVNIANSAKCANLRTRYNGNSLPVKDTINFPNSSLLVAESIPLSDENKKITIIQKITQTQRVIANNKYVNRIFFFFSSNVSHPFKKLLSVSGSIFHDTFNIAL